MKKLLFIPLVLISVLCLSQKISELPTAVLPLSGSEMVPTVQSGSTRRTTVQDVASKAVADAINNGTTTIAPSQNAVFDALCIITDVNVTGVTTSGGTITLNFQSGGCDKRKVSFSSSASFASPKTMALSNTTNASEFTYFFTITNLAATLTYPADWGSGDDAWDDTTTWTPPETGDFIMTGKYNPDDSQWAVSIYGAIKN